MNKQDKLTKETFSPDNFTFVDLGLPSGRQWATENAPGHYTFDEACEAFGGHLPKGSAMVELIEECKCSWNEEKKGLDIVGPNGNRIFLPAAGFIYPNEDKPSFVGTDGDYWTRMPYSQTSARNLYFLSGGLCPLSNDGRSGGFSVRPCRESN